MSPLTPSPHSKTISWQSRQPRNSRRAHAEIDREIVRAVAAYLKNDLGFNYLVDISSVDHFATSRATKSSTNSARSAARMTSAPANQVQGQRGRLSVNSISQSIRARIARARDFDMMESSSPATRSAPHPYVDGYPFIRCARFSAGRPASDLPGEGGFSRRAPMEGVLRRRSANKPPKIGEAGTTTREPRANPRALSF